MAKTLIWFPANGAPPVTLTDPEGGYDVLADSRGWSAPPWEIGTSPRVTGGVQVNSVRVAGRDLTVAMIIEARSEGELTARSLALISAMRPDQGEGTLRVADDETGRELDLRCLYTGGMEGDYAPDVTLPGYWYRFVLQLLAPDPYWRGPALAVEWTPPVPSTVGFFPFFPLTLGASTVQGQQTVTNLGSENSYGLWTLCGPCTAVTLTNLTSGRTLELATVLGDGEKRIVDMTPGRQSVRDAFGSSLFHEVVGSPVMWPLLPGVNEISVVMPGSSAVSRVSVVFDTVFAAV